MADVLSELAAFPPASDAGLKLPEYDRRIRDFIQSLSQIPPATLTRHFHDGEDPLDILDPSSHSLAYLYVLRAHVQVHGERPNTVQGVPDIFRPQGKLWNKLVDFLERFDPVQIRYAGAEWRSLICYIDRVVRVLDLPIMGLAPIRAAMIRLDPTTGTFTSTHLLYIRLCHEARAYAHALPILDHYIHSFPPTSSPSTDKSLLCADYHVSSGYITARSGLTDKISVEEVHEYFLLGAIAYIGLQKFRKAMLFLEHIITAPTQNVASGLMLEAYKKWVIVNCLVEDGPFPVPRTANSNAMKHIKAASKAYEVVAEIFQTGNIHKLVAEFDVGIALWREDGNCGLVNQLIEHLPRVYIANLRKTYAAIPITTVATSLGETPAKTEAYLASLIGNGHLNASLVASTNVTKPPILRFYSDLATGPLAKSEKRQYEELVAQAERTDVLAEQVRFANHRLSLMKEYLDFVKRKQRKENGAEETMDTSWDNLEQDEDMMADLR